MNMSDVFKSAVLLCWCAFSNPVKGNTINVALDAPVTLSGAFAAYSPFCGSYSGPASVVNDGRFTAESACFAYGGASPDTGLSVFWGPSASTIDIAFAGSFEIQSATVQRSDSDGFRLEYLDTSGVYHNWWDIPASPPHTSWGNLYSISSDALPVVNATGVRLQADSDGIAHGVSEIQVFGSPTVVSPEPGTMFLISAGLFGISALRRRKAGQAPVPEREGVANRQKRISLITASLFLTALPTIGLARVHSNTMAPRITGGATVQLADVDGDGLAEWVGYSGGPGYGYELSIARTDSKGTPVLRIDRTFAKTGNTASITSLFTGHFRDSTRESVCMFLNLTYRVQCFEVNGNSPDWFVDQDASSFFVPGFSGADLLAGDFDGDRMDEILLYKRSTGAIQLMKFMPATMRFEVVSEFAAGNLGSDAKLIAGSTLLVGDFGNFSDGVRDDILVFNPNSGQISRYDAHRDSAGNTTFWFAFRTHGGYVQSSQDISLANVTGKAYESLIMRDRNSGAVVFRSMGGLTPSGELFDDGSPTYFRGIALFPGVHQGDVTAPGAGSLVWAKMSHWPGEPGTTARDDVFLYTYADQQLNRYDARSSGSFTYWWGFSFNLAWLTTNLFP